MNELINDFPVLFSYLWYKDFPVDGWNRDVGNTSDWTIHCAFTMKRIAELLGLYVHFESGNRSDAVIRDKHTKPIIYAEWEWKSPERVEINEVAKLAKLAVENKPTFCFLLTYCSEHVLDKTVQNISRSWENATPLIFCMVTYTMSSGIRVFSKLVMYKFENKSFKKLREQPALPFVIEGTKWEL